MTFRSMPVLMLAMLIAAPLAAGTPSDEVSRLKSELQARPGDRLLTLNLGIAYHKAGNDFWAVRTLSSLVEEFPGDCVARSWLGLAYLKRAFPDSALDVVSVSGLKCGEAETMRMELVRAKALSLLGRAGEASEALGRASGSREGYPGDVEALEGLRKKIEPDAVPDVSWSIEAGAGYATNARMGSATDAAVAGDDPSSALTMLDARVRLSPATGAVVRPVVEAQARFQWFFADSAERFSFFELTGQAGLLFRSVFPRVFVGYRPDWLLLPNGMQAGDSPLPYMMGHRGEFEIEVRPELMIFGGAGHRAFAEMAKTRVETDLGLGGTVAVHRDVTALWAVGGRWYDARHEAWDLFGGSLTGAFVMRLPRDFSARVSATISVDYYPWSAASAGVDAFGSAIDRFDLFVKTSWQAWSPSLKGVRFGLGYELSIRDSSAALYSFTDNRLLLRVRYGGSTSIRRPVEADAPGVPAVDWGVDGGGMDERVRDMLRQDEQVQRSSSCLN